MIRLRLTGAVHLVSLLATFLLLSLRSSVGNTFYITGLFPTGSSDPQMRETLGIYPRAAARFATQQVNQLGLLAKHNVTLKLESFNSGCQGIAFGAYGLIQAIQLARSIGLHDGIYDDNSIGENY